MLSVSLIYLVVSLIFHNYMYSVHLDSGLAAIKNTPSLHWIMMGLTGNGGYNPADYEFTRSFQNPALRNQALWSEIGNRISKNGLTGMLALYARKLHRCFGDGTLALSDFWMTVPFILPGFILLFYTVGKNIILIRLSAIWFSMPCLCCW